MPSSELATSTSWGEASRIIDVSHWQPPDSLNWAVARAAGCVGVIAKYTQGLDGIDPAAQAHIYAAYEAGIPLLGGYHFGNGSDAETQAMHFLSVLRSSYENGVLDGRLIMLDAEQNANSQMSTEGAETFVQVIHDAIGRWPWLYTGRFGPTGNSRGLPSQVLSNCPLLLPAYGNHADSLDSILPEGWRLPADANDLGEPGMGVLRGWQFTDGSVNGGPFPGLGRVDQSRLIGVETLEEAKIIWAR